MNIYQISDDYLHSGIIINIEKIKFIKYSLETDHPNPRIEIFFSPNDTLIIRAPDALTPQEKVINVRNALQRLITTMEKQNYDRGTI